jgi:hypothetical protein
MNPSINNQPFGEVACETEIKLLQDRYREYFFEEAPFNKPSLAIDTYLIIGRRGSGKTSLSQYFKFQKRFPNSHAIIVDNPDIYQSALTELVGKAAQTLDLAIPRLVKVWEYIIWLLIFNDLSTRHPAIEAACVHGEGKIGATNLILELIKLFINKTVGKDGTELITSQMERIISSSIVEGAKNAVYAISRDIPIILAIDSLEHYGKTESKAETL